MTPNDVQTIILDHWPDAQEGAGGFAQVASQASLHKIGEATFKRICGELKVAGIARWEVVPKVIGQMQEIAKDAPTGGDLSLGDRARNTETMIRKASSGTAVIEWPYHQEVYRMVVYASDNLGTRATFGALLQANRLWMNQPEARGARREAAREGVAG